MSQPPLTAFDPGFPRVGPARRQPRTSWQSSLGVSSGISALNLGAFLLHSTSSILFLVFLNATQPFVISQLGETKRQGSLSGTLVFSDELLSMFLVLFWGSLADVTGTRAVAVSGYCFIALSLVSYTWAQTPWPDLLFCRLLFAVGGSAVTAMLSGILNSYSATAHSELAVDGTPEATSVAREEVQESPTESTSLLSSTTESQAAPLPKGRNRHGRLAALTGLMTGVGALIAVFFLLRLPTLLASLHDRHAPSDLPSDGGDEAVRRGTREAFYIVAALATVVAILLAVGLKMDGPVAEETRQQRRIRIERERELQPESEREQGRVASSTTARQARRDRLKRRLQARLNGRIPARTILAGARTLFSGIFSGFRLAQTDSSLQLAYLSGGLARGCTIATTVFIPLLVTHFFYTSGLCSTLPSPDVPPSELKRTCRQAFTVASILSGVIQLIALLLSPVVGYLCEALSPAITLLIATFVGTASFLAIGLGLPGDGDPRSAVAWVAAVGIGFCQIAAIVASLALCAGAKSKAAKASKDGLATTLGGSIAGAYSATGGLAILVVSKLGGTLSDFYAPAAFLLLAVLSALTCLVALTVVVKERTRGNT